MFNTRKIKLELITYGLNEFDIDKFNYTQGNSLRNKPKRGGLWASPINSNYGWSDWCEGEDFGDLTNNFKFDYVGNIIKIDNELDLSLLPWIKLDRSVVVDFNVLSNSNVDAIWLTENGQFETRMTTPGLYGWDCESVLIINPTGINIIR